MMNATLTAAQPRARRAGVARSTGSALLRVIEGVRRRLSGCAPAGHPLGDGAVTSTPLEPVGLLFGMNPILVIGGTGYSGRRVITQLVEAGAGVRVMVRNPETAGLPPQVEVLRGDLTVPD